MLLRYVDGFSAQEIAAHLGLAPATVRVHLMKGVRDCARDAPRDGSGRLRARPARRRLHAGTQRRERRALWIASAVHGSPQSSVDANAGYRRKFQALGRTLGVTLNMGRLTLVTAIADPGTIRPICFRADGSQASR